MSKSENFDLKLHFQFAFCILQVAFFKICHGEKRLFQTYSQSRFAIVICRFANLTSVCIYNTEYTYATRNDRKLAYVRFLAVSTCVPKACLRM